MLKNCGHQDCDERDFAGANYNECWICGRMACQALACNCSAYQIKNPIRRGLGQHETVFADGKWATSYPLATDAAKTDPQRVGYMAYRLTGLLSSEREALAT